MYDLRKQESRMFEPSEKTKLNQKAIIKELSVQYAFAKSEIEQLKIDLADKERELKQVVASLRDAMIAAGQESTKLDNGLCPRHSTNRKYYSRTGQSSEELFDFLRRRKLGSIIKPYVHFGAMQPMLKEHEGQGNQLPGSLFNVVDEPVIHMGGITNFISEVKNGKRINETD